MNRISPSLSTIRRNDLFISYSRRDKDFVQALDARFRKAHRDPWIDWEDIPHGQEWRQAIAQGIEAADAFVFVITPDSVASKECTKEIEQAIKLNKRIIPIVRKEAEGVHPVLAALNWIFFKEENDFETAFQELMQALNTDLPQVQTHTRLLSRAIEWERGRDDGFLLRGKDLEAAEQWLLSSVGKEPTPTELHRKYIAKSREVEAAYQRLAEVGRRAKRIIRISSLVSLASLVGAAIAIVIATEHANRRVNTLNQQTQQLSKEIEDRKHQIEGLNLQQKQLNQDKDVLIEQLKKFGFTDDRIATLLASPPEEQSYTVEQVKQANDSYRQTVEKLVAQQSQKSETLIEETEQSPSIAEAPTPSPSATQSPPESSAMMQRPKVTVEYYPKDVDPEAVQQTLAKLGFNLEIKQPEVVDVPINIIYYGKSVSEDEVKLVAYTLIRAGAQIKYIQPFTKLADEKAAVIQVGALPELADKSPLSVEEIRSQTLPLPRE